MAFYVKLLFKILNISPDSKTSLENNKYVYTWIKNT